MEEINTADLIAMARAAVAHRDGAAAFAMAAIDHLEAHPDASGRAVVTDAALAASDQAASGAMHLGTYMDAGAVSLDAMCHAMAMAGCPVSPMTISRWRDGTAMPRTREVWDALRRATAGAVMPDAMIFGAPGATRGRGRPPRA